jgi:hypothetical protein
MRKSARTSKSDMSWRVFDNPRSDIDSRFSSSGTLRFYVRERGCSDDICKRYIHQIKWLFRDALDPRAPHETVARA